MRRKKPLSRKAWYALVNSLVVAWALGAVFVAIVQPLGVAAPWLMVHLLLLGAASTAIIVWSQHFADTLLRRPAAGGRMLLGARLFAHTVGALAVVTGVPGRAWPLVLAGAVLVALAVLTQVMSLARQLHVALPSRFAPLVRYYIVAGLFLVIGVTLGVVMARSDIPGGVHDRLFVAHIAFNLAGWIGITVLGTVILLWPTVLHTRILPTADAAVRGALPLLALGLLVVGLGALFGIRLGVSFGLLMYLAGLSLIVIEAVRQGRRAVPVTYAGWSMGAALLWFAGSVFAVMVLVTVVPDWEQAATRISGVLVPFAVGFVAQLVVGALSYLVPVVIGGGPVVTRSMNAGLDRFGPFRFIVVNGALLLMLLPLAEPLRMLLLALVAASLLAFVPLAIRAIVAGRHARAEDWPSDGTKARMPALHASSGGMMAAVGTLVLAVAVGVAFVPGNAGGIGSNALSPGAQSAAAAGSATGHTTTVTMTMKNMRFSPSTVRVPAGDRLVIHLTNADEEVHDLVLATGVTSGRLIGGESATVDAGVIFSNVNGWCSITGHRQMGMVMSIVVVGGSSGNGAPMAGMDMGGPAAQKGRSAANDIDLAKKPSAGFEPYDAALPPAASATVHTLTLTVRNTLTEVAPGVYQTLWTYNGTAPGPTLRGRVGDVFEITLVNDATMGHSIDFHAGALAPNEPMRTIQPGQSLKYTFTATRSGIWLYHCSTMPMSAHIANGMYGAVIIDPPGLDAVAHEYVLVQGEYYLGPQKGEIDASKVAEKEPDLVVFNGYADQYRYRPLTARAGERVRVWVLDAGPNLASAFHIVGTQFDTVFTEGDYLLRDGGSTGTGGSQVLGLQPAQGGFVELTFPATGDYSFITHAMSDAERGAAGLFHVTP
ncbi:multicopper oxidase domain-containing protein [Leifsonia sp. Root112D2]|uniref:multicopper oxidase domain-containing protein n=1 Tax=Leifsonia sp. Root112D2 TaxID=1736426 RepID=UPI0006F83600|nr:multicopper oxidase domain-containing protein [Leifsonia sp. Root112D2]KQV07623.1 copper oxidase [Leifsonia sp. Root112D2]